MQTPRDRESEHTDPIDRTRHQLVTTRRRLMLLSQMAVTLTLLEVVVLVLVILARAGLIFRYYYEAASSLLLPQATIFLMGTFAVILFERSRKDGDGAFQELSNLFQSEPPDGGELLAVRVELRRFAAASDLPLVPGKAGPGVYALVGLALLVASMAMVLT